MKILFFLFIVLNLTRVSFSREIIAKEKYLCDDRSQWKILYYNGNNKIAEHISFGGVVLLEGKIPDGIVNIYYEDGVLMKKLNYKLGRLDGISKFYFKNGDIYRQMHYFNGKLHGEVKEYFRNGKIKFIENWIEDKKDGLFLQYDPNGKMRSKTRWREGIIYDDYLIYDKNAKGE